MRHTTDLTDEQRGIIQGVIDHLRLEETGFGMSSWVHNEALGVMGLEQLRTITLRGDTLPTDCGTAACICGWTMLLHPDLHREAIQLSRQGRGDFMDIDHIGRLVYGLRPGLETENLFLRDQWPLDYRRLIWDGQFTEKEVAIKILERGLSEGSFEFLYHD